MTLTEIMAELSAHVEQVEAENRELHAELKAIEDARRKHGQLADMPDVLTAQEIATYLRISKQTVYDIMRKPVELGGLPSFGGGDSRRSIRCLKTDFMEWLESQRAECDARAGGTANIVSLPTVTKGARRKKIAL